MKQYEVTLHNQFSICMDHCPITDCFNCEKCSYCVVGKENYFTKSFQGQHHIDYRNVEETKALLEVFDAVELNAKNFISYMQDSTSDYRLTNLKDDRVLRSLDMNMEFMYQDIEARVSEIWPFILNEQAEEEKQKKIGTKQ